MASNHLTDIPNAPIPSYAPTEVTSHANDDEHHGVESPVTVKAGPRTNLDETNLIMIRGRYEIVDPHLGPKVGGAHGAVYKAHDIATGKFVAVKIVEKKLARLTDFDRMSKECEIHAEFSAEGAYHHIVEFLFGNEGTLSFPANPNLWTSTQVIVTKWLYGGNLEEILSRLRPEGCTADELKLLIAQVALAIAHFHSKGIMHRDIKPANLVATDKVDNMLEMRINVVDFGIAGYVKNRQDRMQAGGGSPHYAAPETYIKALREGNGGCDGKLDVYGLGETGARAVLGSVADWSRSAPKSVEACLAEKLPAAGVDLLMSMLEADPRDRISINVVLQHPWLKKTVAACKKKIAQGKVLTKAKVVRVGPSKRKLVDADPVGSASKKARGSD